MRKVAFFTALVFLLIGSTVAFAGKAPQKVVDVANSQLAALGMDADIIKAVKAQNAEGRTLKEIKKIDGNWIDIMEAGGSTPPLMTALMSNDCAKHLNKLMGQYPYVTEIFVTDNQGANVCQTDATSDYWQGDEAKFLEVFNKGVLVADPKEGNCQVSVPVVEGQDPYRHHDNRR